MVTKHQEIGEGLDFVEKKYRNASTYLTREEQLRVLRKYRTCRDPVRKEELREKLIAATWRFVRSVVKPFEGVLDPMVARQAGYKGLIKSFEKNDLRRGSAVTTVAHFWIIMEVLRTISAERYPISIPENLCNEIRREIKSVNPTGEDMPDCELLSRMYGSNYGYDEICKLLAYKQSVVSLYGPPDEEGNESGINEQYIAQENADIEQFELEEDIHRALFARLGDISRDLWVAFRPREIERVKQLMLAESQTDHQKGIDLLNKLKRRRLFSRRERAIVARRFGLFGRGEPQSLRSIGREFYNRSTGKSLTGERVRQILRDVLEKIRISNLLKDYCPILRQTHPLKG